MKINNVLPWLAAHEEEIIAVSRFIFKHPEIAYQEVRSSECLAAFLERQGFAVERGVGGLKTAFAARFGEGRPVLGFLAEYDALPGLGHACGHNLLGTGAAAAAAALKAELEQNRRPGTILVLGCPAEEIMAGKLRLLEAGVFAELDAAITWHPFARNRVSNDIWQAQDIKNYTFRGRSAHAANAPEQGRSALDAAELMNVGVNYLREHVPTDVRLHYAYYDNGIPANVVPDHAKTHYYIRSSLRERTAAVSGRVDDCARGAALMTGTQVEIELLAACPEMKVNRVLAETFYAVMKQVPLPVYTPADRAFTAALAREYQLSGGGALADRLEPLEEAPVPLSLGTDVSAVSHVVPTVTVSAAAMCRGTALHSAAAARQADSAIGWQGLLYAARVMALGGLALLETPVLLERAKTELALTSAGH